MGNANTEKVKARRKRQRERRSLAAESEHMCKLLSKKLDQTHAHLEIDSIAQGDDSLYEMGDHD